MDRDFIIVVGMQGFGKSVWTRLYGASKARLLEYNPKADTPTIDYLSDPADFVPEILDGRREKFRFGTYYPDDIPCFVNTAYAASRTTMIFEECALIFDKGENLPMYMRKPVFMGREPEMNLVLVAQRAMSIPLDVRSQANRIVTFLQTDPADVKAISDRIGREYRERIPTLPRLTCLDWQAGGGVREYPIRY